MMNRVAVDVSWATSGAGGRASNPLTDAGLAAIVGRFRSVHTARLQHCTLVTDAGLGRLAAGCPNLGHLDVCWCEQVTDAGLERLRAAGCKVVR